MFVRCSGVLAAALLTLAAPAAAQPAPQLKLESITARLLYTSSGALSDNIAPPAEFTLFNTVIGEGDAAEPANDVLVSAIVTSRDAQANGTEPLTLVVRDEGGKVLARRVFDSIFVDGARSVSSVLVQDVACVGPVTIEATMGRQRLTTSLDFACGE